MNMDGQKLNVSDDLTNSTSTAVLLESTYKKYLSMYLPIIVFMSVTTFLGVAGNIFTILFYGVKARKTSTIVFIIALASLDLSVCLMACTTIADMSVNVYFEGDYLCKTMYFFDHWTVVSSVLVLWIISIDRFRKICKPFEKQFKEKSAIIAVFLLIGMSLVSSVPCFVTYEVVAVNLTAPDGENRILGNYCTLTDEAELSAVVTVVNIVDVIVIFTVFVTFVVTYGQIWHVLRKHGKQQQAMMRASKVVPSSEKSFTSVSSLNKSASADSLDARVNTRINQSSTTLNGASTHDNNFLQIPQFNVVQPPKPEQKSSTSKRERNITIMMLAVSVGYVVCFTPYFIVCAIRMFTMTGESEMEACVQFLLRSPFYNSVINPIIFCFFNPQFRRYIRDVILGCKVGQYVFSSDSS